VSARLSPPQIALLMLLMLLLWVAQAHPADPTAAAGLDASYVQALGEALKHSLVFGEQLIFTYGPLGWFPSGAYDPELAWLRYWTWELGLGLGTAALFCAAAWQAAGQSFGRWKFWLCIAAFGLPALGDDGRGFVTFLAALCVLPVLPLPMVPTLALLLAALALTKFSMFPLAWWVVGCGTLRCLFLGERARAFTLLGSFAACLCGWLLLCGQPPSAFGSFVITALDLARAYPEAMSQPLADGMALALGVGLFAVFATRQPGWLLWCVLPMLALVAKACLVRPGPNLMALIGFAACAAALLPSRSAGASKLAAPLAILGAVLFQPGPTQWLWNLRALLRPDLHFAERQRERDSLRERFALPQVQARVRTSMAAQPRAGPNAGLGHGVDMFGEETGLIFLNDLPWNPRPIFQAYSVWTSAQSERNAAHLVSPQGPRFVLQHQSTLDERLPNHEDAASLAALLEHYTPCVYEKGYTLFERRQPVRPSESPQLVRSGVCSADEWVDVPESGEEPLLLALEPPMKPLLAALGKVPALRVEVESSDGQRVVWRLVRGLAPAGVLAAPLITGESEWLAWLSGRGVPRMRRLRVLEESGVPYRFLRAPSLAQARSPEFEARWRYAGLGLTPLAAELPEGARPWVLGRQKPVLIVEAPSRIAIESRGGRLLSGDFGIWSHDHWQVPQGSVEFSIWAGGRRLWSVALDPARRPEEQRLQSFRVELPTEPGVLELFTAGPHSGAYWSGLRLEDR